MAMQLTDGMTKEGLDVELKEKGDSGGVKPALIVRHAGTQIAKMEPTTGLTATAATVTGDLTAGNVSATPGANKIVKASAAGKLATGWMNRAVAIPGAYPYAVVAESVSDVLATAPGAAAHNVVTLPAATAGLAADGYKVRIACVATTGGDVQVTPDGTDTIRPATLSAPAGSHSAT